MASELSEWAQAAQIHPQWQVDDNQLPDPLSKVPAERRYRGGARVVTVSQGLACRPTLKNFMMLNLGACLVRGEYKRLRACVTCERFFYAHDIREKYCGDDCYRRRDQAEAASRMRHWRLKQRTALKDYALATLPKLSAMQLGVLKKQGLLNYAAIELLDDLRVELENGTSFERIWKGRGVHTLFNKLQAARVL